MSETMDRELLKRYHCAVVKANLDGLEKLKARIGSQWAEEFKERSGSIEDRGEFGKALSGFLREGLRLCEEADAEANGEGLSVSIRGCHLCHANEELRKEGNPAMCPVIPAGLQAISKSHGRKATLEKVEKTGTVGECTIKYKVR